jgi:23S rRNA (adenine1618-N6)-methyltransferase
VAFAWARKLVGSNPGVKDLIECRFQPSALECFKYVIKPGEFFDVSMCNPPFHASAADAAAATSRKRRNLGGARTGSGGLNFGGRAGELFCPGGELGFIRRMITESAAFAQQCRWFTTLVSKSEHLGILNRELRITKATDVRIIEMAQGQKQSRILAWTFMPPRARLGFQGHEHDHEIEEPAKDHARDEGQEGGVDVLRLKPEEKHDAEYHGQEVDHDHRDDSAF